MSMLIERLRPRLVFQKKLPLMLSHAIAVLLDCQGYDCCFDYAAQGVRQHSSISYSSLSNRLESPEKIVPTKATIVCLTHSPALVHFPCSLICLQPTEASLCVH